MTWALIPGSAYGGEAPSPQIDDVSSSIVASGDLITITGSYFTPGTKVYLDPGNILIAESSPINTTEIVVIVPYGLPNIKHKLRVDNGTSSVTVDIFVTRPVFVKPVSGTAIDVIAGGAS